jgi:molecular chaperone GrpE (heat shock protein)
MTLKQLQLLLRQHGIETEEIVGSRSTRTGMKRFRKATIRPKPDHAILEVFQRGYQRGEKVVRPAKVVVNDLKPSKQGRHGR